MQPNAQVHPAFAGVLNGFAVIPQRVAVARLIKCRVAVKTEDGESIYTGAFRSTSDAQLDAMDRFPLAGRIDVQVLS